MKFNDIMKVFEERRIALGLFNTPKRIRINPSDYSDFVSDVAATTNIPLTTAERFVKIYDIDLIPDRDVKPGTLEFEFVEVYGVGKS